MLELWTAYGFYLWMLTTALAVIALAWLAWNTFSPQPEPEVGDQPDTNTLDDLEARVSTLIEAAPHMQATLGRALQFFGLMRYTDPTGAQAFALAVANARGDGFVVSSSVRGGLTAKPIAAWGTQVALSVEEQSAIQHALRQRDQLT